MDPAVDVGVVAAVVVHNRVDDRIRRLRGRRAVEIDERRVVAGTLAGRLRIAADQPIEDREVGADGLDVERVLFLNSHYPDLGPEH